MSKKVLAAVVAALSLGACEDPKPVTPVAKPAPVMPSKVMALTPVYDAGVSMPQPLAVTIVDAGAPVVDALVLAHDTPTVDHLARSVQLQADGDLKGALVEARRALFTTPDDVETLERVAQLSSKTRNVNFAIDALGRIAALRTDDATPLIARGRLQLTQHDAVGALQSGRDATARDEGNPEGWQVTGLAQLQQNELAGAIASFEKAVELKPDHGWALNNLGFTLLRANENEKAVEVLTRAAALLPRVAYVQNNLGVALERVGQREQAKAAYQHAMDLSPKYVKARVNSERVAKAQIDSDDTDVEAPPADAHPQPEP